MIFVSIPFKRESVSKDGTVLTATSEATVSIPFKRESVSKEIRQTDYPFITYVSIPFKRESVSKGWGLLNPPNRR